MLRLVQRALFCECGRDVPAVAGLCRRCYFADWRSRSYFGGYRERILARDRCCQVCGGGFRHLRSPPAAGGERGATAHRRLPRLSCALHRRHQLPGWAPPVLVALWEEQHPGWPLQLQLAWTDENSVAKAAA